jgi:hypothetical protein
MERPSVSFGWELDKASYGGVTAGYLPAANSGVAQWVTKEKIPGVFHYTGAVLIITTQNNPHTMWIHWQAEGKAFVNPS